VEVEAAEVGEREEAKEEKAEEDAEEDAEEKEEEDEEEEEAEGGAASTRARFDTFPASGALRLPKTRSIDTICL